MEENNPGLRAAAPTSPPGMLQQTNNTEDAAIHTPSQERAMSLSSPVLGSAAPSVHGMPAAEASSFENEDSDSDDYIGSGPAINSLRMVHQGIFTSQEAADNFRARGVPFYSGPIRIEPSSSGPYSTVPISRMNDLEHMEEEFERLTEEYITLQLIDKNLRPQLAEASAALDAWKTDRENLERQLAATERENESLRERAEAAETSAKKTTGKKADMPERNKDVEDTQKAWKEAVQKRADAARAAAEAEAEAAVPKEGKGKGKQQEEAAEAGATEPLRGQQGTPSTPPSTPPKTPKMKFEFMPGGGMSAL